MASTDSEVIADRLAAEIQNQARGRQLTSPSSATNYILLKKLTKILVLNIGKHHLNAPGDPALCPVPRPGQAGRVPRGQRGGLPHLIPQGAREVGSRNKAAGKC